MAPTEELMVAPVNVPQNLTRTIETVVNANCLDLGLDPIWKTPLNPPPIPMCRLVIMEKVRRVQRKGDAVDVLTDSFKMEGYVRTRTPFYVQPTDSLGRPMELTKEIWESWDDLWKKEDEDFMRECDAHSTFKQLKTMMFSVFDSNH
jgi:hypothetical protein